jgi:hypothetical protein
MWEANRIGMCLPQLKEAQRTGGRGATSIAVDWLHQRCAADCTHFAVLLGEGADVLGIQPGIADCAI